MKKISVFYCEQIANLFEVTGVLLVLILAFLMQFIFNELPCPLCLLQRYGFLAIAFGFLLNFRFGFRPSHYAIILLSSLFTAFVAMRQIALHVIPGSGSYGSAIFGIHMYTWSFILSMMIVVSTTLLLGVDRQYLETQRKNSGWQYAIHLLFSVLIFLVVANVVSTVFECGLGVCAENPVAYRL
jgi:disulfide bond formation protein DsbB